MKTLSAIKISVFAFLIAAASCKKESTPAAENTPNTNPTNTLSIGTIRAKIDGNLKVADKFGKAILNGKTIQLAATGGTTAIYTFNLAIGDFKGTGNYDLGVYDTFGLGVNALYQDPALGNYSCTPQYTETKGKLVVTEYLENKSIKGTFQYKAKKQGTFGSGGDYIEVSDGEFYISLEP